MPDSPAELLPHQTTVRLTLRPDEDTVVNKDEVHNLRHQGLLIEDEPAAAGDGSSADGAATGGQPGTGGADGSGATADGKKAKAPQPPA